MLQSTNASRVRLGAVSLAVAGILFVLYPLLRPFSDESSLQGAAAFASTAWIVAHLLAVVGFILLALGLLGLYIALQHTAAQRLAFLALVLSWIGVGLTLPYYGAEVFGLHALGQEAVRQHSSALLSTGERGRGRLATIDPQGEGIEIKSETNSTSHTNADTMGSSPVPEEGRKLCPPFFWTSKRIVICS